MKLAELRDKSIIIAGFGKEGQDSFLFLQKKFPKKTIAIADRKKLSEFPKETQKLLKKTRIHFGSRYLFSLKHYDIVVRSPGISPATLAPFISKRQVITSQTALFFANCKNAIIGITGTKGKGTTASLIYRVLKKGGVNAFLIGNIGNPALSFLLKTKKDSVFVYELSSFQLLDVKQSPHIAVVLNLFPEHLDYHGTWRSYTNAKANIARYQTAKDILIYDKDNEGARKIAMMSVAKKIPFHQKKHSFQKNLPFIASPEPAIIIGKLFRVAQKDITKAIKTFKPLPHRLELVGTYQGITFFNDSMGTTPVAVIAAIDALDRNIHTIILGGQKKGETSYKELAKTIMKSSIQTVILFPRTGQTTWKAILTASKRMNKKPPERLFAKTMKEAVVLCYAHTLKGRACLLSPAAASFNMFRDYKDRGEQFRFHVKTYAKNN